MTAVIDWLTQYRDWIEVLGVASLAMFVASLVVFPLVVIQLPRDYFVRSRREPARLRRRHPMLWAVLTVVKNAVGFVLILAGIAMLVLPGQGLLSILVGLALTNFPGKFKLERRLARMPKVANGLNRIRRGTGRDELVIPVDELSPRVKQDS
jgi:hypothetical protein